MTSNILQINYNLIEYIQNLGELQNYNILTTIFNQDNICSNLQSNQQNVIWDYNRGYNMRPYNDGEITLFIFGDFDQEMIDFFSRIYYNQTLDPKELLFVHNYLSGDSYTIMAHCIFCRASGNPVAEIWNVCVHDKNKGYGTLFGRAMLELFCANMSELDTIWLGIYLTNPYLNNAIKMYTKMGFSNPSITSFTSYGKYVEKYILGMTINIQQVCNISNQEQLYDYVIQSRVSTYSLLLQNLQLIDYGIQQLIDEKQLINIRMNIFQEYNITVSIVHPYLCISNFVITKSVIEYLLDKVSSTMERSGALGCSVIKVINNKSVYVIDTFDSSNTDQSTNFTNLMDLDGSSEYGGTWGSTMFSWTKYSWHVHPYYASIAPILRSWHYLTNRDGDILAPPDHLINMRPTINQPMILTVPSVPDYTGYILRLLYNEDNQRYEENLKPNRYTFISHIVSSLEGLYIITFTKEFLEKFYQIWNLSDSDTRQILHENCNKHARTFLNVEGIFNCFVLLENWYADNYNYITQNNQYIPCDTLADFYCQYINDQEIKDGMLEGIKIFKTEFISRSKYEHKFTTINEYYQIEVETFLNLEFKEKVKQCVTRSILPYDFSGNVKDNVNYYYKKYKNTPDILDQPILEYLEKFNKPIPDVGLPAGAGGLHKEFLKINEKNITKSSLVSDIDSINKSLQHEERFIPPTGKNLLEKKEEIYGRLFECSYFKDYTLNGQMLCEMQNVSQN